jgi:hypothetical protein
MSARTEIAIALKNGNATPQNVREDFEAFRKHLIVVYAPLIKKMDMRPIRIMICDEYSFKRLGRHDLSMAVYVESDKPETIYVRRNFKKFTNQSLSNILKHELIHAKLRGKEHKQTENEHGAEYRKLAYKYGVLLE